jgi:hypothetical protein
MPHALPITSFGASLALLAVLAPGPTDTVRAAEAERFAVRVDVTLVRNGTTTALATQVGAPHGQVLRAELGGTGPVRVRLTAHAVAGAKSPQYAANLQVVDVAPDGTESLLNAPALVVEPGRDAELFAGEEDGNHLRVRVRIDER